MSEHMLGYHVTLMAFMGPALIEQRHAVGIILFVSIVTHSFIDRRWPVTKLLRMTHSTNFSNQMWGVFVVDQVLHISILCVLAAVFE